MNLAELKLYRNWIGTPVDKVYFSVKAVGGWAAVFPDHVPRWASKVRNYFNVLPTTLRRLPAANAKHQLEAKGGPRLGFERDCWESQAFKRSKQDYHKTPFGTLPPPPFRVSSACPAKPSDQIKKMGWIEAIAQKAALSSDVYLDEVGRTWFQLAAGSTIFHFGRPVVFKELEAAWVDTIRGQNDTPVFKLVRLDQTGGSHEVILGNDGVNSIGWGGGSKRIGGIDETWDIRKLIVTDLSHQGSYNYAETTVAGLKAHDLRDIKPHIDGPSFYVNPKDMHSALELRKFPEFDLQGKPLVGQN